MGSLFHFIEPIKIKNNVEFFRSCSSF